MTVTSEHRHPRLRKVRNPDGEEESCLLLLEKAAVIEGWWLNSEPPCAGYSFLRLLLLAVVTAKVCQGHKL